MVDELKAKDRKNAKASPMGGVQHISRSGEKGWNDDKPANKNQVFFVNRRSCTSSNLGRT